MATYRSRMVTLTNDRKANHIWLITTTDSEGFHRQLPISHDDMTDLMRQWMEETICFEPLDKGRL